MNWNTYVEKQNEKIYKLPAGVDSRDEVAAQLSCAPERVDDHLRPSLKSGVVIKQQYRIWNRDLKRLMLVFGYHEASPNKGNGTGTHAGPNGTDAGKMRELKSTGKTYAEIGRTVGKSADAVRAILRRASGR